MGVAESVETLERLSGATGLPYSYVDQAMRDVHFVIDTLVAADGNVLLGPLYYVRRGNPVVPAMVEHFTIDDWRSPEGLKTAPPDVLAEAIGLPVTEVVANPCFFGTHVWSALCDWRGVPVGDKKEADRLDDLLWAWRRDMESHGVSYRMSTAGLESVFETWLVDNLSALARYGVHVDLVARQPWLDGNRRRADLLCRLSEPLDDLRAGDLLVIENKATPVGIEALGQVNEYADFVYAEMATRRQGVGVMLVADGTTVELQHALYEQGALYASLAGLGYREHLYRRGGVPTELDESRGTDPTLQQPDDLEFPDGPS